MVFNGLFGMGSKDCDTVRVALSDAKGHSQGALDRCLETANRRMWDGRDIPEPLKDQIDFLKKDIRDKDLKLGTIDTMPRILGQVLCSSGNAIRGGRIHDWGFIKLSNESSRYFQTNRMPVVRSTQNPGSYGCGRLAVAEGSVIDKFGEFRFGEWYFRVGRSSTHAGVSNGVAATCNWDGDDRNRYDEHGNLIYITKGTTKERIVLNRRVSGTKTIQGEFDMPGDSGSLIINKDGEICGLYYGNATSLMGPDGKETSSPTAGLIMPMAELLKGI